ncbi:MAG: sulfotransferase [Methylovulum sp.]|nr:sulfotransferase [Methylovulum sp.]
MIEKLLIGAGAMKAGTTWLYKQLETHPKIHFTPEKEIHYFSYNKGWGNKLDPKDRARKLNRVIKRQSKPRIVDWYRNYAQPETIDDQWYCSLFKGVPPDVYCADFSNQYSLIEEDSLRHIQKIAKEVKVIYTLRDPLERLWSHVKFQYKYIDQEDLVDSLTVKEFRKLISKPWFWKNVDYVSNYDRLVSAFGENNVKLFYLEDFIAFPQGSLWSLEKFLDIRHVEFKPETASNKVNRTKELVMPEQWERMARRRLKPYYEELYSRNLSHPSWRY